MTIFDLPALDPDEAFALAVRTLERFPILTGLYEEPFLRELIRRRGAHDNFLLLLLVQPEDEVAIERWTGPAYDRRAQVPLSEALRQRAEDEDRRAAERERARADELDRFLAVQVYMNRAHH